MEKGPEQARVFRYSLHGSLESFQRDQRIEDAFYMALECLQTGLDAERLFERNDLGPDSDVEGVMKEIAEKGVQSQLCDKIKSSPEFASILCADCLLRFSFQVTTLLLAANVGTPIHSSPDITHNKCLNQMLILTENSTSGISNG